jgi:hypothetical protein
MTAALVVVVDLLELRDKLRELFVRYRPGDLGRARGRRGA